jgi:hypothetical protein
VKAQRVEAAVEAIGEEPVEMREEKAGGAGGAVGAAAVEAADGGSGGGGGGETLRLLISTLG